MLNSMVRYSIFRKIICSRKLTNAGGSSMKCEGKVAVVVGGGSGIGAAAAELFVEEGATVAIADLNEDSAAIVARKLAAEGAAISWHSCDVTDMVQTDDLISQVLKQHG